MVGGVYSGIPRMSALWNLRVAELARPRHVCSLVSADSLAPFQFGLCHQRLIEGHAGFPAVAAFGFPSWELGNCVGRIENLC